MAGNKRTSSSLAATGGTATRRRTTTSVAAAAAQTNQPEPDVVQSTSEATAQDNTDPPTSVTTPNLSKHIMNLLGSKAAAKKSLEWMLKVGLYDPRSDAENDPTQKTDEELKETASRTVKLGIFPSLLSCIFTFQDAEVIVEEALAVFGALLRILDDFGDLLMAIELDALASIIGSMKAHPQNSMILRMSIYSLGVCFGLVDGKRIENLQETNDAAISKLLEIDGSLATIISCTDSEELKTHQPANRNLMNLIFDIIECDNDLGRKYKMRELLVAEGAITKVAKVLETFTEDEEVQECAREAMYKLIPKE